MDANPMDANPMDAVGTVVELQPKEGLGWIALDDGTRVLFGGSACKGSIGKGQRVKVIGTKRSASGKLKAVRVESLDAPEQSAKWRPETITWDDFVVARPGWSDAPNNVLQSTLSVPQVSIERHPWFEPWMDEIRSSFAPVQWINVPDNRRPRPFVPRMGDSLAFGFSAFLESEDWPVCGSCNVPLEMCLQLAPEVVSAWVPDAPGRGLVAMYCFRCRPRSGFVDEVVSVVIGLIVPRHEVRLRNPPPSMSARSSHKTQSQQLGFGMARSAPSTLWYRYRSERVPSTASAGLFGYGQCGAVRIAGVGDMDEFVEAYEGWVPAGHDASRLGGVPSWDQRDDTPSCGAHGEMRQLLQFSGADQFLDGALHVFLCRAPTCQRLAFVAEF